MREMIHPAACPPTTDSQLAEAWRALCRGLPRPLVFTSGVFDILHAGHVRCLQRARNEGASLVVGIHSDASARRLRQGPGRPFNNAEDRARVVAALATVSAVMQFDEDKPLALICALRPDVYVKGGDHDAESLVETALVAEWGGRTVIVPRYGGLSTSAIIERARFPLPACRAHHGASLHAGHKPA